MWEKAEHRSVKCSRSELSRSWWERRESLMSCVFILSLTDLPMRPIGSSNAQGGVVVVESGGNREQLTMNPNSASRLLEESPGSDDKSLMLLVMIFLWLVS